MEYRGVPYTSGFVKCAIANCNSGLSNPQAAFEKMRTLIEEANEQGVDILIFPELSTVGYTCQDLLEYQQLLKKAQSVLWSLVGLSKSLHPTFLFVVGAPINVSDTLYNCAVVIQHGKVLGIVPKQYLPNYGEFYEKRWFTPYTDDSITSVNLFGEDIPFGNLIFSAQGSYKLGIEICEDLWSVIPPSSYLALSGANIIANLSASNELVGKDDYRKELIKTQSSRTISAYLYTSSGFSESTSDLVFGGSGYAFENGKEVASLERYQMDDQMKIFDIDIENLTNERICNKTFSDSKKNLKSPYREISVYSPIYVWPSKVFSPNVNSHPFVPSVEGNARNKVCKEILAIQSTALARRLIATKNTKVTIGISGGLDSTLALLVCHDAFKKLNLDMSGIIGITMPGFGTTDRTYNNAVELCKNLGTTLYEIPIRDACLQHFKDIGHDPSVHDITYENVQARERTQILMDMANKHHGLLVGTGDLSELVLGWCTYNGDHMSMYGVNCSIPKTLVKYLIEWYATQAGEQNPALQNILLDIISTPISPELLPTDGKEVVQKTENSVGPYEVIDFFIYNLLRKKFSREKILYLANLAFADKYTDEELAKFYDQFIRRFFQNQFKRNCIPDGPKVGTVSISPRGDLRMPSDADSSIW